MQVIRKITVAIVACLFTLLGAAANGADSVRISLVTVYQGPEIYELEGHTLLRIQSADNDWTVNYGLFDFDTPNFAYRFVKGETDYMCGAMKWAPLRKFYTSQNRRITEQVLNLSAEQKDRMMAYLLNDLRPENSTYRYNYVADNCVTRCLEAIEAGAGDSIVMTPDAAAAEWTGTWRSMMSHYHRYYPWYQLGIDLALGTGIDVPIGVSGQIYAPVMAEQLLANATVGGKPLVSETVVLNDVDAGAATKGPTPWYLTPMTVFALVFVTAVLLSIRDLRRNRPTRWFDSLLFGVFGIGGLVIAFLVFVSTHYATSPNWQLLGVNPLCLVLAALVWIKKARKLLYWSLFVNFALILAMFVAIPVSGQHVNSALWPLFATDLLRTTVNMILLRRQRANRLK